MNTPNADAEHVPLLQREVGLGVEREMFACPHCGHQLSMFMEQNASRADRIAGRVAVAVGSWPFLLILVICIAGWCLTNLFVAVFDPHPSAAIDILGTSLGVVAAIQGPLILLTQRRESDRDRARDMEAFYIAQNTEADLHAMRHALHLALGERGPAGTS